MPQFTKGNNIGRGRPKGSPNKVSLELKETLSDLLKDEFAQLKEYKNRLPLEKWLDVVCKLTPYVVAKQSETTLHTEQTSIPFDSWFKLLGSKETEPEEVLELFKPKDQN